MKSPAKNSLKKFCDKIKMRRVLASTENQMQSSRVSKVGAVQKMSNASIKTLKQKINMFADKRGLKRIMEFTIPKIEDAQIGIRTCGTSNVALLKRNADLAEFVMPVMTYLKEKSIVMSEEKIKWAIYHSFDCGNKKITSCLENFAKVTGLSIAEVSELMTLLDPAGSCSAVRDYVIIDIDY